MRATPSFIGQRAIIVHRPCETTERLARQLGVLGLRVDAKWAPLDESDGKPDFVLVDADAGWDGLLNWEPGQNPMPVVALLGSEAPGRIAWALEQGANALIVKPIAASAVFPALVMADHQFAAMRRMIDRFDELQERVRLRPLVIRALEVVMTTEGCDEAAAYRHIRRKAMQRRVTIEQVAATLLADAYRRPAAG